MAFWARVMSSEPWAWQALAASHHDSSTGSPANEGELWLLRPWWGCRLYSQAVVWSRDPGLTRQAEERMAEPVGTWAGTAPLEERGLRSYSRGSLGEAWVAPPCLGQQALSLGQEAMLSRP